VAELPDEAMEVEFDTVASWTEQAVRALGAEFAVPAGCRGSGSESALRWLADGMDLSAGSRVLDDGAGVGGPAGWLAAERGVSPVCAEPMVGAVRAATRLFGLPAVVAAAQELPFPDASFDAAWCLGVLCTIPDKSAALGELRRVLTPGGRVGLLVFAAVRELTGPLPDGNTFPAVADLPGLLATAGLRVGATGQADLSDSPAGWTERAGAVDAEIERRHGHDERWALAQEQSGRVGRMLADGALVPWLGIATAV